MDLIDLPPEAGLVTALGLLVGGVVVMAWPQLRKSHVRPQSDERPQHIERPPRPRPRSASPLRFRRSPTYGLPTPGRAARGASGHNEHAWDHALRR